MRGQYEVTIPLVQIPAAEGSIGGIIVPANTKIQLNRLRLVGASITANNAIRLRIRQFTGNTPTLSNANTPRPVVPDNAIASAVSFGDRGAAGTSGVWSATPTTPAAFSAFDRDQNLYGGVLEWASSMQELKELGGASAAYYDILGIAGAQTNASLVLVFTE